MLMLLRALSPAWRFGLAITALLAVLGGVGGLYAAIRHQGYVAGEAAADARCAAEKAAQEKANREAIADAEKRLLRLADQLSLKDLELDHALADVDDATAADPRGADKCLDADGVRRLQTIR